LEKLLDAEGTALILTRVERAALLGERTPEELKGSRMVTKRGSSKMYFVFCSAFRVLYFYILQHRKTKKDCPPRILTVKNLITLSLPSFTYHCE